MNGRGHLEFIQREVRLCMYIDQCRNVKKVHIDVVTRPSLVTEFSTTTSTIVQTVNIQKYDNI